MPISTRDLSRLPDTPELEKLTQSLAVLDAILCPAWEYRYFSFDANWNAPSGERMASMRNGSGDEYFLLFTSGGAILKGFDHKSPMSSRRNQGNEVWPGVLDHVPAEFPAFLAEPAFNLRDTTFCIWKTTSDSVWHCGPISFPEGGDPDGSESLLWALGGSAAAYARFAHDYLEKTPAIDAMESVFLQIALTRELVAALNPEKDFDESLRDARETGYRSHAQNSAG